MCQIESHIGSSLEKQVENRSESPVDQRLILSSFRDEAVLLYNIICQILAGVESGLDFLFRRWESVRCFIREIDDLISNHFHKPALQGPSTLESSSISTLQIHHVETRLQSLKRHLFKELPGAYSIIFPSNTDPDL